MKPNGRILSLLVLMSVTLPDTWALAGQGSATDHVREAVHLEGNGGVMVCVPREEPAETYAVVEGNLSGIGVIIPNRLDLRMTLRLAYDGTVDSPVVEHLFYTFDQVFQESRVFFDLREAFLELHFPSVRFRLGLQVFDWGQIDEWNITDLVNTEDYRQFILRQEKDRKIGLPALSLNGEHQGWGFELFYAPIWIPYRMARAGERWFSSYANSIHEVSVPREFLAPFLHGNLTIPLHLQTRDIEPPKPFLDFQAGIRLKKTIGRTTVSALYFHGSDPFPNFDGEAVYQVPRTSEFLSGSSLEVTLFPVQRRIDMWGMDFTTEILGIAFRGEAAFIKDRYYNRFLDIQNLSGFLPEREEMIREFLNHFFSRPPQDPLLISVPLPPLNRRVDELQAGLQADYFWKKFFFSVFAVYSHLFHSAEDDLLVREDDLLVVAMAYADLWNWKLSLKATVGGHVVAQDFLSLVSLEYLWGKAIATELGYLYLEGPPDSLMGQFNGNDMAFLKAGYRF